ncbi:MAG: class I SAM-dependent methyltransferase [Thermodesulfobacteriota bacterium]
MMTEISPNFQKFKTKDASSYDSVTDEFDRFTERLSIPLVTRMISLAQLAASHQILDIGTGTGIVALHAAQKIGTEGKVIGVDLSDKMLERAKLKALRAGLNCCVEFRRMDAEALDLENCTFDTVFSLFALLHFPNPLSALKEMLRVLRPGGRLVLAIGSSAPLLSLTGLSHIVRRLPGVLHKLRGKELTAPRFLNSLVEKHFPEPDEPEETALAAAESNRTQVVLDLVGKTEFTNVRSHWEGHRTALETPEEFWDLQRTFSSIARKRLSRVSADKVDALREEFLDTCRKVQSRGGKLVYPYAALFIAAERPSA